MLYVPSPCLTEQTNTACSLSPVFFSFSAARNKLRRLQNYRLPSVKVSTPSQQPFLFWYGRHSDFHCFLWLPRPQNLNLRPPLVWNVAKRTVKSGNEDTHVCMWRRVWLRSSSVHVCLLIKYNAALRSLLLNQKSHSSVITFTIFFNSCGHINRKATLKFASQSYRESILWLD